MIVPPASRPDVSRFVVITAVRDEERFLPRTIASMLAQTARPEAWIVVDDGSTDGTARILAEAAAGSAWIRVVTLPREPRGSSGEAASLAFNRVLPLAREHDPDAVAMLDGDTEFAPDFYERLLGALSANPRLGIVGADALEPHADGTWGRVRIPRYHVHGAVKVYRRGCIELIGGLEPGIAWDTVDIVRARLRGWDTRTLPEVTFRHLRVTGSAGGLSRGPWIRGPRRISRRLPPALRAGARGAQHVPAAVGDGRTSLPARIPLRLPRATRRACSFRTRSARFDTSRCGL